MNKISSYEDSVSGAVDVAREVQRRDLVTEETGKTITHETEELEDRLERLKAEAIEKKKRSVETYILRSLIEKSSVHPFFDCQSHAEQQDKSRYCTVDEIYIPCFIGEAFNFCVRGWEQASSSTANCAAVCSYTFKFFVNDRS